MRGSPATKSLPLRVGGRRDRVSSSTVGGGQIALQHERPAIFPLSIKVPWISRPCCPPPLASSLDPEQ